MATAIEFDTDTVNKIVADAILGSTLGVHLRALAEDQLKTLRASYNNPVKEALQREVYKVVEHLVATEFRPKIEEIVRAQLTDEVLSTVATAAWNSLQSSIRNQR